MSRLIDADALEELFREVISGIAKKPEMNGNLEHMVRASAMVIEMIQDAPTIEEQEKGKWIDEGFYADGHGAHAFRCSECGGHIIEYDADPFCKWCGADMRGEQDA